MKKILFTLLLAVATTAANAQWIRVWNAGESTRYAISNAASLPYSSAGSTLTIGGDNYSTSAIDSITIVNPVAITWNGNTATVNIPETAEGVSAQVSGANVVITNTCTTIEHEFILSGNSTAGSFTYYGDYKTKFHLNGLTLTSSKGGAIDIQCGKRIDLILEDGTTNTLSDATTGDQKAAFNCQGHLEVSGGGSLSIAGNCKHALRTNEYLQLKKTTGHITITKSVSDGIHCGEYFQMNGGTLVLSNIAGDGIQVETDATSDESLNGQFIMNGGSIDLTVSAQDSKGIRLDAATGTSIVPEMHLLNGSVTVNLTSGALGSKAIASDGNLTIGSSGTSPVINVTVAGGVYVDPDTEEEDRATGLKAEKTLTINGGNTTVNATGTKSRGVRTFNLISNGGVLTVTNSGSKSQGIKLDGSNTNPTYYQNNGGTVNCNNWKF